MCLSTCLLFFVELLEEFVFLRRTESYICLEVTPEIGTGPQFTLIYGVQGMGLISFIQTEGLTTVFQSDRRE